MSEKQPPKEKEPKPEAAENATVEELTEEQLEHVAGGAMNAYLKLSGIPGESTVGDHKATIDIESFSWSATQPTNTTLKR
jgi:Type VI secretion system effector, Hcp